MLLPTGDVLLCGGLVPGGDASRTSYLYSSSTGTVRPTVNQLNVARAFHALVAVRVGSATRVLAIGGYAGTSNNYRGESSVELLEYDSAQSNWRWRPIGSLSSGRGDLRASWDGADHIVVTGGYANAGGALRSGPRSAAAEEINVTTLAIQQLPAMDAARAEHASAHILDENGVDVVLVAGGEMNSASTATQILERGTWNPIANPPLLYRSGGIGFGDLVGIARTFGGFDSAGVPTDACEWYDVKRGWRSAPRMIEARGRFDATVIAGVSDTVRGYLAAAGVGRNGLLSSVELFFLPGSSFPNGSWTPFKSLVVSGAERMVAIAGSNLPIATGGTVGSSPTDGFEVFQPLRADDITFADEEVGRRSDSMQLVVRNEWLLPVRVRNFRIAGSAAFFFTGDTADFVLVGGASRTVRLYFQPGSTGRHAGGMVFDVGELTDTVKLTGNGIASTLAVINSPFDFGSVLVAGRRQACFYALRNNGTDTSVIDSVVLEPAGTFRLVSPLGRVSIPPGDSLRLCVEFTPTQQGNVAGSATIHLGNRAFPTQVIGKGVRRYVMASVLTTECDTVIYQPGVAHSSFVRLTNPGDSVVTVTMPLLAQSVSGLFHLADSAIFPLDLTPGESRLVEVVFTPARESRENVTVTFPNNGDTVASVSLCFIARSRFLSVSQSDLNFGDVCVGDTVSLTLLLENPGGFDRVTLFAADIDPTNQLSFTGFAPVTLGPREYLRIVVSYAPDASGTFAGTLTIRNSHGDLAIPITANALASAQFVPDEVRVAIGATEVVPVMFDDRGAGGTVTRASLRLAFDPTLIVPLRIVQLPGGPALDLAASSIVDAGGGNANVVASFGGAGLSGSLPAFGIEVEALRGDGLKTSLALRGNEGNAFCLAPAFGRVDILPPCWGEGGSIRPGKISAVFVAPRPASDHVTLMALSPLDEHIVFELVRSSGEKTAEYTPTLHHANMYSITVETRDLPTGMYLVRARAGGSVVGSTTMIIKR